MLTLWDLIKPLVKPKARPRPDAAPRQPEAPLSRGPSKPARTLPAQRAAGDSMAERYEAMTRAMLVAHGVRVRRWRRSMSGVAWEVRYRDGRVQRLIESPRPKGPMSAAVFLHEIGHHAIGLGAYRPRCLEEYHAWAWALEQMDAQGLRVTDAVRHRMHDSLHYAVRKAARRGIKQIPAELAPFLRPRERPSPGSERRGRSTR